MFVRPVRKSAGLGKLAVNLEIVDKLMNERLQASVTCQHNGCRQRSFHEYPVAVTPQYHRGGNLAAPLEFVIGKPSLIGDGQTQPISRYLIESDLQFPTRIERGVIANTKTTKYIKSIVLVKLFQRAPAFHQQSPRLPRIQANHPQQPPQPTQYRQSHHHIHGEEHVLLRQLRRIGPEMNAPFNRKRNNHRKDEDVSDQE